MHLFEPTTVDQVCPIRMRTGIPLALRLRSVSRWAAPPQPGYGLSDKPLALTHIYDFHAAVLDAQRAKKLFAGERAPSRDSHLRHI